MAKITKTKIEKKKEFPKICGKPKTEQNKRKKQEKKLEKKDLEKMY